MTQILIAGYYGFGNLGDEAILASILSSLRDETEDAVEFLVVSGNPLGTQAQHGVHAISWERADQILDGCRDSDLLVLGGGGLFHDYLPEHLTDVASFRGASQASFAGIPVLGRLLQKKTMLYGLGLGPLRETSAAELAMAAVQLADVVSVRDGRSLEHARRACREAGLPEGKVRLSADPAFGLRRAHRDDARAELTAAGIGSRRPILGICLRQWQHDVAEGWEQEVAAGVDAFLAETQGQAVFIPFQHGIDSRPDDDLSLAKRVRSRMGNAEPSRILDRNAQPALAAALIAECDLILGMRLHSVIFALGATVPCVGLSYDPKVSSLLERAGLADCILPHSEWRRDLIQNKLNALLSGSLPRPQMEFANEMRSLARQDAAAAAELLKGTPRPSSAADRALEAVALRYFDKVEDGLESIAEHARRLLRERNQRERELRELRETLGVRLLSAYWSFMHLLFPEGGRGRFEYRRGSQFLRHLVLGEANLRGPGLQSHTDRRFLLADSLLDGVSSDAQMELVRFEARVRGARSSRIVAVFSTNQLIESEGQRPSHFALELARRGIPVVFLYWRWDRSAFTTQERLDDLILQIPMDLVTGRPNELFQAFSGMERTVLFEFPHPAFFALMAVANGAGWTTVYDVVDDWHAFSKQGFVNWYQESAERHLAWAADSVWAVNRHMADKIEAYGRGGVEILPNGCPDGIQRIDTARELRRGDITLGYFGYLANWFDWRLLASAARSRPLWRFYVVGYGMNISSETLPDNVAFLGKQPQSSLASLAANWDVGIVPFREGPIALGADPIKTYEYLAMGLPVVMTGSYPPPGSEGFVRRARGEAEFVRFVEEAAREGAEWRARRTGFAANATWARRADELLSILDRGSARMIEKRALFSDAA